MNPTVSAPAETGPALAGQSPEHARPKPPDVGVPCKNKLPEHKGFSCVLGRPCPHE
ncbi:hypothetical protein [Kitasatospora sp. NPDC002040]|uniref:hypothetical protein n=1 Tax=Kitasatospora sp. NPDC002040 TaxID=3154661 RepID=UPI00331A4724